MDEQQHVMRWHRRVAEERSLWNVSASAKFPEGHALLPHHGLADAITPDHIPFELTTQSLPQDCCAVMAAKWEPIRFFA
jgi:hypothetical protein